MNKRSTIASIDVGTTKICTTIAETTGNGDTMWSVLVLLVEWFA
jgi:cell division ATPase FtsA